MVFDQESGPTEEGGVKTGGHPQGLCGPGVLYFLTWMADYMGGSLCENELGFKFLCFILFFRHNLLKKFT